MSKYRTMGRQIRSRIIELVTYEARSAADIIFTLSIEFNATDFIAFRKEVQNIITYLKSSDEIHALPERKSCPVARHSVFFYKVGINPSQKLDPILIPRIVWSGYIPPAAMPTKASWLSALA